MTHATYAAVTMTEVQQKIVDFAGSLGWTTDVNNRSITMPGGQQVHFEDYDSSGNYFHGFKCIADNGAIANHGALVTQPVLGGSRYNGNQVTPTQVHVFGEDDAGHPWIAAAIEYGYNLYRHFYMGRMKKIGDYTGRHIIAGSYASPIANKFHYKYNHPLFTNKWYRGANDSSPYESYDYPGVLEINHSDFPQTVFPLRAYVDSWGGLSQPEEDDVMGGLRDGPNDHYVLAGAEPWTSRALMTSVNLYAAWKDTNNKMWWKPVGHPPGVRFINIERFEPAAETTVGADSWKVFPLFSRNPLTGDFEKAGGSYYATKESSWIYGVAYRM